VIYFTVETKRALRKKFLEALKVNGMFFIGATETMLDVRDTGFQRLSACFYRKKADVSEKNFQEPFLSGRGAR